MIAKRAHRGIRSHVDLPREPRIGDEIGRDPDQERRAERGQHRDCDGTLVHVEPRGHITSRRIESSVPAAAKASP